MTVGEDRPRVVLDCMIFLQAVLSETGPAAAILRLVDEELIALYLSDEILEEVRNVLSRPSIRKKNVHLTDERVEAFLLRLLSKGVLISGVSETFTDVRDPKDQKYLDLAIEVRAEYLVSRDYDLLDLARVRATAAGADHPLPAQLAILDPAEFLRAVEKRNPN